MPLAGVSRVTGARVMFHGTPNIIIKKYIAIKLSAEENIY